MRVERMEDALGLRRRHIHTTVPKEVGWARSTICVWHWGWGYTASFFIERASPPLLGSDEIWEWQLQARSHALTRYGCGSSPHCTLESLEAPGRRFWFNWSRMWWALGFFKAPQMNLVYSQGWEQLQVNSEWAPDPFHRPISVTCFRILTYFISPSGPSKWHVKSLLRLLYWFVFNRLAGQITNCFLPVPKLLPNKVHTTSKDVILSYIVRQCAPRFCFLDHFLLPVEGLQQTPNFPILFKS